LRLLAPRLGLSRFALFFAVAKVLLADGVHRLYGAVGLGVLSSVCVQHVCSSILPC
jgi:hypothetical protein